MLADVWTTENILAGILGVLCAAWWLTASRIWRGLSHLSPLSTATNDSDGRAAPSLVVIIPACNEADTLEAALSTLRAQEYPNLHIKLVNDRSDDETGDVVDRLAAADPRIEAIHITDLPDGWLGKTHAMHTAVEKSSSDWILFTDADVHFAPDALKRAVAHAEQNQRDMLAVLPDFREVPGAYWLNVAVGTFVVGSYGALKTWEISDPAKPTSIGLGAFNLVRRTALEKSPGLPWMKLDVNDDLTLAMMLKQSGAAIELANGTEAIGVEWYPTLRALILGFEKGTFAGLNYRYMRMVAFASFFSAYHLAPLVALTWWSKPWLVALGATALLAYAGAAFRARSILHRKRRHLLMLPLGAQLLLFALVRAAIVVGRRGGISWRGTFYSLKALREAQRFTLSPKMSVPSADRDGG